MDFTTSDYAADSVPDSVFDILQRAEKVDGIEAFSEAFVTGLRDERLRHRHIVAKSKGEVVGIAATDGATAELVVDPDHRRAGHASTLLDQLGAVPVWAHGNLPAAQALAATRGLDAGRTLFVMGRDLAGELSAAVFPEGLELTDLDGAIRRFGRDAALRMWLEVNNDAFSWHPEQGGWDLDHLQRAIDTDWFRPADVLLLLDGDKLAGFHWMKWHTDTLAETYVVGLASSHRGQGLGGPLMQAGLNHVASQGATRIILYVESDNTAAVKAYRALDFAVIEEHVLYS